jgi:hypothetical protein
MLCKLERREAILVKIKWLAYPLSAVKLINALSLRKEGSYPGKKGLAYPLSAIKIGHCSVTKKGGKPSR